MRNNNAGTDRDLSHVYWIGGSGCAGKSTVADVLAKEHDLVVYHGDEHWFGDDGHLARATPDRQPATCRGRDTELEVLFNLPPKEYAQLGLAFFAEDFEMMLEDLYALPKQPTVVEGVSVLPSLVAEIADPRQIVFMVAYEEFQRKHYLDREFAREWFQDFSNPQVTFDNLMTANDILARNVGASARELGLKVIVVDENWPLQDSVDSVAQHFGLAVKHKVVR